MAYEADREKSMKKRMKRAVAITVGILAITGTIAFAQTSTLNVGNYTNEDTISLYVKGIPQEEEITQITCQIGTNDNQAVVYEKPGEVSTAPRTLVLLDNSISISKGNREKIKNFLSEYAYSKPNNEEIALVCFSEDMNIVTEYVTDKTAFNEAVNAVEYQDQDTHLIDNLYEALHGDMLGTDDCYKQIIIIADGVDNQEIGYTQSELEQVIKERNIPIYALGCKNKSNNEQLENMFAIARSSNGICFLLDEMENMGEVATAIVEDAKVAHFVVTPEKTLLDGSQKEILITMTSSSGEVKITQSVNMPFLTGQQKAEEENVDSEATTEEQNTQVNVEESTGEVTTEEVVADLDAAGALGMTQKQLIILIIMVMVVFVILIVLLIVLVLKNREKANEFVVLPGEVEPEIDIPMPDTAQSQGTPTWNGLHSVQENEEETQAIWGYGSSAGGSVAGGVRQMPLTLILTDLNNPGKMFQTPFSGEIVIGRSVANADLVLDQSYRNVSNRHCLISERGGRFYLRDLGSSYGTMVNGAQVFDEIEIASGCEVTLGVQTVMRLEIR